MGATVSKLRKVHALLRHARSEVVRRGARKRVAPATEHLALLQELRLRSVVDVGANRGQFALATLLAHPTADIFGVEPLSGPGEVFRFIFRDVPNVRLLPFAASDRSGRAAFFEARADDSSSLFRPTAEQLASFPGTGIARSMLVDVAPLDDLIPLASLGRPLLVKFDVQGAERLAIAGAPCLLDYADYVLVEASTHEFYKGQALAHDLISDLTAHGFRLTAICNPTLDYKRASVVQMDLFFTR